MDGDKEPTLSDVMNAIITSVGKARQVADFEAMRSAMMYQKIDLLKGLPVPRMRINNVKISIPMILSDITPEEVAEHKSVMQIASDTTEIFKQELAASIDWVVSGIKIMKKLSAEPHEKLARLKESAEILKMLGDMNTGKNKHFQKDLEKRLAYNLAMYKAAMNGMITGQGLRNVVGESTKQSLLFVIKNGTLNWVQERVTEKDEEPFDIDRAYASVERWCEDKIIVGLIEKVKFSAENISIKTPDQSAELGIIVDTEHIKNAGGGPENVTRLSFVLREEGLEWITETDQNGNSKHGLSTE